MPVNCSHCEYCGLPAVMLLCCLLLRLPFPLLRLLTYRRLLLFFPLFFLLQFHTVVVVDVTVSVSASTAADGSVVSAAASVAVCYSASSAVIATVVSSSAVGGSVQSSLSALAASVQSLEPNFQFPILIDWRSNFDWWSKIEAHIFYIIIKSIEYCR